MVKRILRILGKTFVVLLSLVMFAVVSAAIALQTRWAKHRIGSVIEEQLNSAFTGHFQVGFAETHVGLAGLEDLNITLLESEDGAELVTLRDVEVGWLLRPLLHSLRGQSLRVELPTIVASSGFVDLSAPQKFATAFAARNPSTGPDVSGAPPSVLVDLGDIELHDVTVRIPGQDGPMNVLVSRVDGQVWVGEQVVIHAAITHASATARQGLVELDATGVVIVDLAGDLTAAASANAHVGDARIDATGSLVGDDFRVVGTADASSAAIEEWDLGWSPTGDVVVDFGAVSERGIVETAAATLVGGSALDASAAVKLEPFNLQGTFRGRELNPADYSVDASPGSLSLEGQVRLDGHEGALLLGVQRGRYAGEVLPPMTVVARETEWREFAVEAHTNDDSRTTVEATLVLGEQPTATLKARSTSWRGVPASSMPVNLGNSILEAQATFDADFHVRQASARVDVDHLALPGQGLVVSSVRGQVQVAHSDGAGLSGNGRLRAGSVRVAGQRIDRLNASIVPRADGLQANVRAEVLRHGDWLPVNVVGVVKQDPSLEVADLRVDVHTDPKPLSFRARRLYKSASGDWILEGGSLSGAGNLRLDGTFGTRHQVALTLNELDLERVGALAVDVSPVSGTVTGQANLEYGPADQRVSGDLKLSVDKLRVGEHTLSVADVELNADGRLLTGRLNAALGDTTLAVSATEVNVEALRHLVGKGGEGRLVDFIGRVTLEARATQQGLKALLPDSDVPPGSTLDVELVLEHTGDAPLELISDVVASVDTSASADGDVGSATIHLVSTVSETSPAWVHSLHLEALDGGSADMEVEARLPLATIPFQEWVSRVRTAQLDGESRLNYSDLGLLPRDLPLPGLKGQLSGYATIQGSIENPVIAGALQVHRFQVQSIERSLAVDIEVKGRFSDHDIVGDIDVVHDGTHVASVDGTVDLSANTAALRARLEDFSIGCFPYLRDYGVEGRITGFASLTTGEQKRLSVYLLGRGFTVYGEAMPFWSVAGTLDGATAEGRVQVTQLDGKLDTEWDIQASDETWKKIKSVHLATDLDNFEIRPLLVVARGPVANISGKVNGSMDVELANQSLNATGKLRLTRGSVLVPVLGKDIREVELDLLARPGRIDIEGVKARFGSGRFSGGGSLAYARNGKLGLAVDLDVAEGEAIPILSEGREIAELTGRVTVKGASDEAGAWNSTIDLNRLRININEDGDSQVGALEGPDYVQVGHRGVDGKFKPYEHSVEEPTPGLEAEPIKLRVNLVNDVWVYRGRSTFASVEGALDLELGREVRIEGGLQVPEGRIDVMGRVFEVQPSTVTFSGETPPNPEVVAMASWRSPSGHLITASYRGPAASGKMQLMSEPPLSYGEILNVLLFDDPTGAGDASEGSSSASAVAGTLAGAGLGRTISDLTNLNIQTTVETTESGASRPEVGIRLSPRFAFQVSYNPQPVISLSEPPDQATVSLDWRISKRWSLDTSLGDQGSASADLAWEFRY